MKAVILAGGKGERLFPETEFKPKPMVEIGGKPILWHIMKIYSVYSINEFIICVGYKGYIIKEYFANYFLHNSDLTVDLKNNTITYHSSKAESWKITIVDTGENTQTGGRLKRVAKYLKNENIFCFTYGDCLADVNIEEEIRFHKLSGKKVTALATRHPARYAEWRIFEDKIEIVSAPQEEFGWFCGGFFVVSSEVLDYIEGDETDWNYVLGKLNQENQLSAYKHKGFWYSLETLKDKNYLDSLWFSGKAPWKVW